MDTDEILRCNICGEFATHTLGVTGVLELCDNVVCYQATVYKVNEALKVQGEV